MRWVNLANSGGTKYDVKYAIAERRESDKGCTSSILLDGEEHQNGQCQSTFKNGTVIHEASARTVCENGYAERVGKSEINSNGTSSTSLCFSLKIKVHSHFCVGLHFT